MTRTRTPDRTHRPSRRWPPRAVGLAFTVSGIVHLVRPSVFESLIPQPLPRPTELVYVSGVAELVCAAGLFTRRRWAGPASVAVLLGVWPGNVQMAIDVTRAAGPGDRARVAAVWARLPLQVPMMWAAMQGRAERAEQVGPPAVVMGAGTTA